jgi:type IX secretion system PorP/SprF family membrane protein
MRVISAVLILLVSSLFLQGQDPDFSQHYATPLSLNPALAGTFNGTYRVGGVYRDAWRIASPAPITTYVFNGEYRFKVNEKKKNPDYAGAGIKFFSDRTSLIEQNTNAISALFAYHKSLSQYRKQILSFGLEVGLGQKNLNYENLFFEDQFNDVNGFEGFTEEDLQANNFAYADFSMGLNYSQEINKKNRINAGLTFAHLSTPNVSFWRRSESLDPDLVKVNNIPLLYSFQLSAQNQLSYFISIQPRIIAEVQGPHVQLFAGSTVRFDLGTNNKSAVHVGGFGRLSNSSEDIGLSHLVPFAGFEVNEMLLGLSYDINTRDFSNQYQGMGVLEISITYTGEVVEDSAFCPQF